MEQLREVLEESMNRQLYQIIISNRRKAEAGKKVVLRPYEEKGKMLFQFAEYRSNQVFHRNVGKEEAIAHTMELLRQSYKQIEIVTQELWYTALVSKKGKATIKSRPNREKKIVSLNHNRKKQYILPEGEIIPFLVELGVQTKEGRIVEKKYKKYRQINRFLEYLQDVLPELPKDRTITILDVANPILPLPCTTI